LIPDFDGNGLLPLGVHDSSLDEIANRLGFNARRQALVAGLRRYANLWVSTSFITHIVVDGSFVTSKPEPGDIDLILVLNPAQASSPQLTQQLSNMILTYCHDKEFTKHEFGLEAFPVLPGPNLIGWLAFFGHDKLNRPRGIVMVSAQ